MPKLKASQVSGLREVEARERLCADCKLRCNHQEFPQVSPTRETGPCLLFAPVTPEGKDCPHYELDPA